MGKKKTKTTNTYTYMPKPDTADTQAARAAATNIDLVTPVATQYGQMERDVKDDQFYESELPDGAKEKIKLGRLFNLRQNKGAALGAATAQQEAAKSGNLLNVAALTQPNLVQTGGTTTVSDPWGTFSNVLGGAGSVVGGMGSMGVT
ncbi:MAG TPA: hypothetical protein VIL74_09090 [Pyrinomonadaceae bacterium]|jgi:N-acetylmuramoyl-L-alanine amidase CwlA